MRPGTVPRSDACRDREGSALTGGRYTGGMLPRTLAVLSCVVTLVGSIALAKGDVAAQARTPLQGVWQVTEFNITGPTPRTIALPEPRANLVIFTARHYSRVEVQTEAKRPVLADASKATADELRATWGPFVGEAGTYEVAGNIVTMRPIASKNPAIMGPGVFLSYTFTINGNTLTLTQDRNQTGPFPNPFTIKATRLE